MTIVWGMTDGSAGTVGQVKALAGALGIEPEMKKVMVKAPLAWVPNAAGPLPVIPYGIDRRSDSLAPPYPDLVISCGRKGAMVAMGLKSYTRNQAMRLIHIQDPQCSPKHFDLVVAMEHDKISGPNVLKTRFSLHSVTRAALTEARVRFIPKFINYPKPYVTVLIGGATNKYVLGQPGMAEIIAILQLLLANMEGSLLITPSRRTGETHIAMLKAAFAGDPRVYIYDFSEENPYLGLLALADHIVVTNDSVNMMSEAAATGKPIHILPLPGHKGTKPSRFAERLVEDGMARVLGDRLKSWSYDAGDEMAKLAEEVRKRLSF